MMDRREMDRVLRRVDDAVNSTVGYTHVQALAVEEDVNGLARRYAEEAVAGGHADKAADPALMDACESMLGILGLRPRMAAGQYASAMVQWYIDQIKEDRNG